MQTVNIFKKSRFQTTFTQAFMGTALAFSTLGAFADSTPSDSTVVTYVADAAYGASDLMNSTSSVLKAAQLAIGSGQGSGDGINCPMGGSITATVTINPKYLTQLYSLSFNQCMISAGITVNGSFVQSLDSLTIVKPTQDNPVKTTDQTSTNQFNDITVTTPLGATVLSGKSKTISHESINSSTHIVYSSIEQQIADGNAIVVTSSHPATGRASSYSVHDADITQATTALSSTPQSSTVVGQAIFTIDPSNTNPVNLSVSFAGGLTYDASGTVNGGTLTLTMPGNTTYTLKATGTGKGSICADVGSNGSCDAIITWGDGQISKPY